MKPGTFVDVIELLLPELRKRGLFWDDYFKQNGTYRENIRSEEGAHPATDHPAAKYQWRAGVAKEDAVIPPEPKQAAKANGGETNGKWIGTSNETAKKRAVEASQESDRSKRRNTRVQGRR